MKRQFRSFFAGMITTVLIAALALSVMAITGKTSIDVYPINIMVNGEVFQPTNAQGKPVDVFTYKGTTYAPLRALAEAYGLEVGYDAEKKLATVSEPEATTAPDTTAKPDYSDWSNNEEEAYEQFKSLWNIIPFESVGLGQTIYAGKYSGELEYEDLLCLLEKLGEDRADKFASRIATEVAEDHNMEYNDFGLYYNGQRIYMVETKDGSSTIYERIGVFQ